jgi:hypothetical protein
MKNYYTKLPPHCLNSGETAFLVVLDNTRLHPKVLRTLTSPTLFRYYALSLRKN